MGDLMKLKDTEDDFEEKEVDLWLLGEDNNYSLENDPLDLETDITPIKKEEMNMDLKPGETFCNGFPIDKENIVHYDSSSFIEIVRTVKMEDNFKGVNEEIIQGSSSFITEKVFINNISSVSNSPEILTTNDHSVVSNNAINFRFEKENVKTYKLWKEKSWENRYHRSGGIEKKELVCNICCMTFKSPSIFSRHFETHTGEKSFSCDVCEKSFSRAWYLNVHKSTHTRSKQFVCDVCEKSFTNLTILKEHKRTHSGEKPFVCDVCQKPFIRVSHLNQHKRIHSGEKPFVCDVCKKMFNCSSHLKRHKSVHTGEKPFECDVCGKSFSLLFNLNEHKRIHTGEKPFVCNVCGKSYAQKCQLIKHKCTKSGKKEP